MKGWSLQPLEEIAELYGGSTPSRENPAFWGGDIPWVTPTDLPMPDEGISVVSKTKERITQAGLDNSSATVIPKGTVLFSSRATIGKVAVADMPLTTNQGFANFVPHSKVTSRFLAYALWVRREDIARLSGSTTFKEVSRSTLRKYQLPVPPLGEQERIVKLLDEADELRKLRAQADRRTADLIPALFHEMFGDPQTNPNLWKVGRFQDVCTGPPNNGVFKKIDEYGTGTPVVWVEELYGGLRVNTSNSRRLRANKDEIERFGLRRGDVLFCRSSLVREGIGQSAYYDGENGDVLFECHVIRFSPNLALISPEYAAAFFRHPYGKMELMRIAKTATMTTIVVPMTS